MESKEVGKRKVFGGEELTKQLDRLLQDNANNQRIRDWVEVCDCTSDDVVFHTLILFNVKFA